MNNPNDLWPMPSTLDPLIDIQCLELGINTEFMICAAIAVVETTVSFFVFFAEVELTNCHNLHNKIDIIFDAYCSYCQSQPIVGSSFL